MAVVGLVVGVQIVGFLMGNGICHFLLGFEVNGFFIPFHDCGRDLVCGVDSFHERNQDSSRKEVDECIIIGDFTKSHVALELGNIVSKK